MPPLSSNVGEPPGNTKSPLPPPGPPIEIGGNGLPPPGGNEGGGRLNLSESLSGGPLLRFSGISGGGSTGKGLAVGSSFVSGGNCCIEPIGSSCGGLIGP